MFQWHNNHSIFLGIEKLIGNYHSSGGPNWLDINLILKWYIGQEPQWLLQYLRCSFDSFPEAGRSVFNHGVDGILVSTGLRQNRETVPPSLDAWPFANTNIKQSNSAFLIPSGQLGIFRMTLRRRQGVNVQMQEWKAVVLPSHVAEWFSPRVWSAPNLQPKTTK